MRYRVVHRTSYRYARPVTSTHGEHRLLPRATPTQHVVAASVAIDPPPEERRERRDVHGNRVEHYAIHRSHDHLDVTASSLVAVQEPPPLLATTPWEEVRARVRDDLDAATIAARSFVLDSPRVAATATLDALARRAFTDGRPVGEAYAALVSLVHAEFAFDPTATTVTTPLARVLTTRAGVCQDFAHLTVGLLRSLGLPARYVSGYIETDPPPGTPRLQGADASHAWVSLFVPGHGWHDADPTNDGVVGARHVTVAWGRDYGDVPPLAGVLFTEGTTDAPEVAVDVLRVDGDATDAADVPVG